MNPVIQHRCSARTIFSRRDFLHLGGLAAVGRHNRVQNVSSEVLRWVRSDACKARFF
jgi:hypothetical protein